MLKLYCMKVVEPSGMFWKPESRPSALRFVQGAAKDDWVTVWFFDTLVKSSESVREHPHHVKERAQSEADHISVLGSNFGRRVREGSVCTDHDVDDLSHGGAEGKEGSDEC